MKVLVVGTGGALGASGITTMADQMTRTLTQMGHEPTRLVAGGRRRQRPNRLNIENVLAVLTEAAAVARAARRTRTDVVWLHTFGVPTLPATRTLVQVLAVRATGRPIIVQFHAFALAETVEHAGPAFRRLLRWIHRLSWRLIVLQPTDAAAMRSVVGDGVAILPNWTEVDVRPEPLPPAPPFVILFVGALVRRKGLVELIESMRLLEDLPIRLRIVGGAGDDGPEFAKELRHQAADLVTSGRVTFVGQATRSEVHAELASAHLLVLPSRSEGMPMAVLEAMAQGRPVLVGDTGDLAAVVRGHGWGIVIGSQKPAVLASALRAATGDGSRLPEQGRRGHQLSLDRFSEGPAADRLAEVLSEPR